MLATETETNDISKQQKGYQELEARYQVLLAEQNRIVERLEAGQVMILEASHKGEPKERMDNLHKHWLALLGAYEVKSDELRDQLSLMRTYLTGE